MNTLDRLLARGIGWLQPRGRLTVLQFHRVLPEVDPLQAGEIAAPEFERVLDFIQQFCTPIGLREGLDAARRGRLPPRALAMSFDDGYADWVQCVGPLLLARGIPATFFVTTGQLGGGVIWHERIVEAVRALPDHGAQLPYGFAAYADLSATATRAALAHALQDRLKYAPLDEREQGIQALERQAISPLRGRDPFGDEQVRWLHAKGFAIGAHTHNHPILNSVCDEEARDEIGRSREILEGIVRDRVDLFAYPNGRPQRDFSQRHRSMVEAAGYVAAVTTGGGVLERDTDPFLVPRFSPWTAKPWRLAAQLARNAWPGQAPRPNLSRAPRRQPVLFVENGAGFGGAIVALQTLLQHADTRQHAYHVVTNLPVGRFASLPQVERACVIRDHVFDARALAARFSRQGLPGPLQRLLLFLLGRADDLLNRLPFFCRLLLLALRLRPALIHGNNELASNREALLVAWLLGIPYVQHVRGPLGYSRHQAWLLRQPRAFIPVSQWLARSLAEGGAPVARVRHLYDGVQTSASALPAPALAQADLRAELGLPPTTRLVALVGMLLPWKGQSLFLDALGQQALGATAGVSWLLIGGVPERSDGSYQQQLQQRVAALAGQADVRLLGHRADMAQLFAQLDVVVSASMDPEPLGLVMLEALSAGCVFVGPAHGAAPELVRDGDNGHLFTPRDSGSLAAALRRALHSVDSLPRAERAQRAAQQLQVFEPHRAAQDLQRLHGQLIGSALHP